MDPKYSARGPKPISRTRAVLSFIFGGGEGGGGRKRSGETERGGVKSRIRNVKDLEEQFISRELWNELMIHN